MKATTWFCPVLFTLLCASKLVCTAQRGAGYPGGLDYVMDINAIQDDYLLEKRNKPSLSIVNPLDVLRQRLLLEIARRQMKENTRQVELNRAILKNVGKRMLATRHYQQQQQQMQREQDLDLQQQQEQLLQQHFPRQVIWNGFSQQQQQRVPVLPPSTNFYDFLQQQRRAQYEMPEQQLQQQRQRQQQMQNRHATAILNDMLNDAAKKSQQNSGQVDILTKQQQQHEEHQSNGNEIANETNHEKLSAKAKGVGAPAAAASSSSVAAAKTSTVTGIRRVPAVAATGGIFSPASVTNDFNWPQNVMDRSNVNTDDTYAEDTDAMADIPINDEFSSASSSDDIDDDGNGLYYLQRFRNKHYAN